MAILYDRGEGGVGEEFNHFNLADNNIFFQTLNILLRRLIMIREPSQQDLHCLGSCFEF